jgi:hypothetical protein
MVSHQKKANRAPLNFYHGKARSVWCALRLSLPGQPDAVGAAAIRLREAAEIIDGSTPRLYSG